jgi:hypothetical protein
MAVTFAANMCSITSSKMPEGIKRFDIEGMSKLYETLFVLP